MTAWTDAPRCRQCGEHVEPADRFCRGCGAALAEGGLTERTEGERRIVTVMFCDIVGSAALSDRRDPEEVLAVLDAFHRTCIPIVERHGGHVARYLGDGLLVYFGYPRTDDLMAVAALQAGLELIEAVQGLADRAASGPEGAPGAPGAARDLQLHVGVHTGLAILATVGSGHRLQPDDVVGDTPNLAARLQALAGPGDVVASRLTADLAEGWFEFDALGPHEVKGFAEPVEVMRVVRTTGARDRLEAAGPAGVTPFVARPRELAPLVEAWQAARAGRARVVWLEGEPGIGKSRLVHRLLDEVGESGDAAVVVAHCRPDRRHSALFPLLEATGSAEASVDEMADELGALASGRPLLLVLEDVQWTDPSTLEAVTAVASKAHAVLLLVTARPQTDVALPGGPEPDVVAVGGLDRSAAAELVDLVAGDGPLDAASRSQILERAEGVPLFLEELTRAALEDQDAPLPTTIFEVVTGRLDRLGPARHLAEVAAVIGRTFDDGLLAAIVGRPLAELQADLDQLVDHAILEPEHGRRGPSRQYRFRHALLRDAAYSLLLRAARRELHAKVADQLAAAGVAATNPQLLAAHLAAGGRPAEAAEAWVQASKLAIRSSFYAEAVAQLEEALALLDRLPLGARRDGLELRIERSLAWALSLSQGDADPAVGLHLERLRVLASERGDTVTLALSCWPLVAHRQAMGDYRGAAAVVAEARQHADEVGEPALHRIVDQLEGATLVWMGELARGRARLLDTAEPLLAGRAEPSRPEAIGAIGSRGLLALTTWLLGRADEARDHLAAATAMAEASGEPQARSLGLVTKALVWQLAGDPARVVASTTDVLALPERYATRAWHGWALGLHGWATSEHGQADGLELLDRGLALTGPSACQLRAHLLSLQAERLGPVDPGRAAWLAAEAVALSEETGERFSLADLHRIQGDLAASTGDRAGARAAYLAAAAFAVAQGAAALELRARWRLVALDDDPRARDELGHLAGRLAAAGTTPDLDALRTWLPLPLVAT